MRQNGRRTHRQQVTMQQPPLEGINRHAQRLQGRRSQHGAFPCFSKYYGGPNRDAVKSQSDDASLALHSAPVGQQEASATERRNADGLQG